ncbi:MAG: Ig-like domain-containing protein, partial [bacterium]
MKNRILALLLIMCLSGTMTPALAEDAISMDEGIEAPVPEVSEDDAAILLEDTDTTEDDDEPEAPVEVTEIEEPLSDAISAESAAAPLSVVGHARVIEAVGVYDDASELIRESLPVDAVVYVETVTDDRAQVAFASVDGIVRGWMDAAVLMALDEAEVSALYASAGADPEAYRFIDDTLPLPLFDAVVEPLALSQTLAALSPGDALTLTVADGRAVTWFSEDEAVATVSEDGTVTAVSMGETNIFAVDADGQTDACEVRVTLLTQAAVMPDEVRFNVSKLNIGLGEVSNALQVILGSETGVDYIRELTFESAKTKYVTVNADGQLVGVKKGSSTITVHTSNGLKATCKVTVKSAPGKVTIAPSALTLNAGETKALTGKLNSSSAAGGITWSSSDEAVATVDANTGKVTAIAAGSAIITAKTYNNKTTTATVRVRPAPESLAFDEAELTLGVKQKVTLAAKLNPGADCEIRYATSDPKVVSIKGNTFTAAAAGTATITASTYNGLQATCVIHVESAPKSVTLPFKTLYLGQGDT